MIDLHLHSSASDGSMTPFELITFGAQKGLQVMALTDHDTIGGLKEAHAAAIENNVIFVPGIEINIQWPKGEFHLLGLGIKTPSKSLLDIIAFLGKARNSRNEEILKKMQSCGLNVDEQELKSLFQTESLGRPHIADYLVMKNKVKNRQQAFDKFLGQGRPFYVPRAGANLDEAVVALKESGAVPVIAHPLSLYLSWGKIEDVLIDIFDRGVLGLEAWHPGVKEGEARRLEEIGRRIGFFITAGSDFHGEKVRSDRKIGKTSGAKEIDSRFWTDELKPHLH